VRGESPARTDEPIIGVRRGRETMPAQAASHARHGPVVINGQSAHFTTG
jgi:hypothetical protein